MNTTEEMNKLYKLYIIKCEITGKSYVGYTDSVNPKYNPLSYLYNQYKRSENRYKGLGESIKEHKYSKHHYTFLREGLTQDEASELALKLKQKLGDKCLNDERKIVLFDEELSMLDEL